jgi:hypothetical protein
VPDARSIRVLLDVQRALAGDPDAEHRLRVLATSGLAEGGDAAQAYLGLARLAWRRERYDEALAFGDAVIRTVNASTEPTPQPRVIFRVAVAVLHLWMTEVGSAPGAEATAVALLTAAREDVGEGFDNPLIGAWALGGAELAAFQGADEAARELWALGVRFGANVSSLSPFTAGEQGRLAAVLGSEEQRKEILAALPNRQLAAISSRIRELMAALLA